eukprot:m.297933 g.297933  ORF g.297933 m.297933 type:complete len:814 (+) comp15859_c0_seq4:268-2709(+)
MEGMFGGPKPFLSTLDGETSSDHVNPATFAPSSLRNYHGEGNGTVVATSADHEASVTESRFPQSQSPHSPQSTQHGGSTAARQTLDEVFGAKALSHQGTSTLALPQPLVSHPPQASPRSRPTSASQRMETPVTASTLPNMPSSLSGGGDDVADLLLGRSNGGDGHLSAGVGIGVGDDYLTGGQGMSSSQLKSPRALISTSCQTDPIVSDIPPPPLQTSREQIQAAAGGGELQLDRARRLQERENARRNLSTIRLWWYNWNHRRQMRRLQRRDPTPLWRGMIKTIEGKFGTGLASFFVFMRWLFLANLFLFTFYTGLVALPMAIRFDYNASITEPLVWYNVFDGEGAVGDTWLFYGGYDLLPHYRMDLAYILVPIFLLVTTFYILLNTLAKAARSSRSSLVRKDHHFPFGTIVLTSWDHSLSAEKAVSNLRRGVGNALVDVIAEHRARELVLQHSDATLNEKCKIFALRVLAWVAFLVIVGGSFAAVWFMVLDDTYLRSWTTSNFIITYVPTVVFSFINGALPLAIKRLTRFEFYKHPRTENSLTIFRTFILRIMTIYALMYGYFSQTNLTQEQTPIYNSSDPTAANITQSDCAGTRIGQQVYKLVLIDTVIGLLQRLGATLFWYWWLKRNVELDLVQCVLHLVYRQALIWIGMCFSPIIPTLAVLTNLIYFYFYYALVNRFCRPPFKRWNQNRNNSFFMMTLAVSLFLIVIPLTWALTKYKPNCGPFRNEEYESWFSAISIAWLDLGPSAERALNTLLNPIFLLGVFVILSVWISVERIRVKVFRSRFKDAEKELKQMREDRRLMLLARNALA